MKLHDSSNGMTIVHWFLEMLSYTFRNTKPIKCVLAILVYKKGGKMHYSLFTVI